MDANLILLATGQQLLDTTTVSKQGSIPSVCCSCSGGTVAAGEDSVPGLAGSAASSTAPPSCSSPEEQKKTPSREMPAPSQTRNLTARTQGTRTLRLHRRRGGHRGGGVRLHLSDHARGSGEAGMQRSLRSRQAGESQVRERGGGGGEEEERRIRFLNRAIWLSGGDGRWSCRSYLLPVCVWMLDGRHVVVAAPIRR
jgi:hypothetical protein